MEKKHWKKRVQAIVLAVVMVISSMQGIPGSWFDFGAKAKAGVVLQWPVPGHTVYRGMYSADKGVHDNNAIDINGGGIAGATVVAALGGTVTHKYVCAKQHYLSDGDCHGFGTGLVIRGDDGRTYQYAHMQANSIPAGINKGSRVSKGQQIGKVGTTGNSSGYHLHFGICYGNYWEGTGNPATETYQYGEVDQTPNGWLDNVSSAPGQLSVYGWAKDEDNPNAAVKVHVYVDGPAGQGTYIGMGVANCASGDVGNHRFQFTLSTNLTGNHNIYIHAINIDKSGADNGKENPVLRGCPKSVYIQPKINYTVNTGDATDVQNKKATLQGSTSPAGDASAWGFYIGTSTDNMKKVTVSAGTTASSDMKKEISAYYTLNPGTKYYYKTWAVMNGDTKTGSVRSFTTTAKKPEVPTIKMNASGQNIGISDSPIVYWNATDEAEWYKLHLYDENGEEVQTLDKQTGTKASFKAMEQAGTYTATVEAYNSIGTKGESASVEFTVHPDVTVTFQDADEFVDAPEDYQPEILGEYQVHWGHDSKLPASPSHQGYTFKKWKGEYQGVKEDTTVEAVYEINTYTVKFVESESGDVLKTEKVTYYASATPPDYSVEDGYAKTGYDGWDKNYKCITEDTVLHSCIGWYNENFPVFARITSAVREYDAENSENEGYTVMVHLKNNETTNTKGRVVVALKTEKGKLLTSTESSAFSIKKSAEKDLEIFVPYGEAATLAEVYVIGQYKDAVPYTTTASNNAVKEIDQSSTYTNWSTAQPPESATKQESRTEYRYQDKTTTTSYATSLSGYTQSGSQWVSNGSGSVDYVASFPSGFNTGSSYYSTYHKTPPAAYENATDKRTVSTSIAGYLYWHWCRGSYTSGPINRKVSDGYSSSFPSFHCFTSGALGYNSSAGAFQLSNASVCRDTYWWLANGCWNSSQLPVYRCSYQNYRKLFTYYKWSNFTDWSTEKVTASSTRKVESRKVYRYQSDEVMKEDTSGEERTVKGSLGSGFAGKEAALFIYKVDEASDYTNEYIAQTVLDDEGNYSFTFKLREEPSVKTGDFTVVLGVEGTSTAIYLDTIQAPVQEYTVTYYDYDGKEISTQKVKEGENAELPDESQLTRTGYTFSKWSDTNVNITENKEIYAQYDINTYDVVFVDWQARTVDVQEFEYGAKLVCPQAEEPEEGMTVQWDAIAEGNDVVTEDMIVTTQYEKKKISVEIRDYDNQVISSGEQDYGTAVELPELETKKNVLFLGWKDISQDSEEAVEDTLVTKNVILCPNYVYEDTVETPKASVESGTYAEVQKIELSCDTDKADIYYTTDGSNPNGANAVLYTEPIVVDDSMELKFVAYHAGMNNSEVVTNYYTVNGTMTKSDWMLKEEIPEEILEDFDSYGVETETGYRYKETKTVTLSEDAAALELLGWKVQDDEAYTDWSEWQDTNIQDDGSHIKMEVESRATYAEAYQYQYSHYTYEDGTATKYSPTEVEGKVCTPATTAAFDVKLKVAGFDENDEPYYIYDGQTWYNQKRITGKVANGAEYRSRYKKVTYYKWSDWEIEEPSEDETREVESQTVYCYDRHNKYVIQVIGRTGDVVYTTIAEEGDTLDLTGYTYEEGYTLEGVYTDPEYTEEWTDTSQVTKAQKLYLKQKINSYTVTFLDKDGETIKTEEVEYGGAAEAPQAEEVEGYIFTGWDTQDYLNVQCEMTVMPKYVAEGEYATVALDNESITLFAGKHMELTPIITPTSQSGTELSWKSENENVAVVSDSGEVTAVAKGETTITVTVKETGEMATCKVTVKVDTDSELNFIEGTALSVDSYGCLRGITVENNTVKSVCGQFTNSDIVCKNADGTVLSEDDLLGTGSQVCLVRDDEVLDSLVVVVTGDISGDGAIGTKDVSMLSRMLMEKQVPSDVQILAGDVNGDGEISNRDVVMISRIKLGKNE